MCVRTRNDCPAIVDVSSRVLESSAPSAETAMSLHIFSDECRTIGSTIGHLCI